MFNTRMIIAVGLLMLVAPVWSAEVQEFLGNGVNNIVMQTVTGDTCVTADADGETAMEITVRLQQRAHLLVSFTFEWGSLDVGEEGLLSFGVDGGSTAGTAEWGFAGTTSSRTSGNLMWAFADVPSGEHTVAVGARVEGGDTSAELNDCGLTVMVLKRD
jgi:hypothetical protein